MGGDIVVDINMFKIMRHIEYMREQVRALDMKISILVLAFFKHINPTYF